MIVIPGKIPIMIHPFFWVLAFLIGFLNSASLTGMFVWVLVILVSVLFHEFGHALTALCFQQKARIQLVALGGLTTFEGPRLSFAKQFLIVFNGPLFGFFLFLFASFFLRYDWSHFPILYAMLKITQVANLFWSIVNLLPVLPLDGGQLLRIVLEARFGIKGFKASLLIGSFIALLLSLGCFLIQAFLVGAIFFLFAYQSFDSWRKSRIASAKDRIEENRELLERGEEALRAGRAEDARRSFEGALQKTKEGLIAVDASQYLALLFVKEGKRKEAYDLLLPIREHLSQDLLCLLHRLAFEYQNYDVVADLSAGCYQVSPSQDMALRNARSFAFLKKGKMAGGWLQTAASFGHLDLKKILQESEFHAIDDDVEFQEFVKRLQK